MEARSASMRSYPIFLAVNATVARIYGNLPMISLK
jgi:hypothetical protein